MDMEGLGLLTPEFIALTVVSEASIGSSVTHRSNRRVASRADDSVERATKLKAARNLDTTFVKGMQHAPVVFHLDQENILLNLHSLGFSFINDSSAASRI
jgi:hypothetical protein